MRDVLKGFAVATVLASAALVHAETVTIACGPEADDLAQCKKAADEWAKKTGNEVKYVKVPESTDYPTQFEAIQHQLSEKSKQLSEKGQEPSEKGQEPSEKSQDVDVYRVDVVWPGLLAEHFIDLKLYIPEEVLKQHFPAIVQNNTVGGKLVAMPWFADAGLLFYRKDLLKKYKQKKPTTWQELEAVATTIQQAENKPGKDKLWGFVFEAKAEEELMCNALEWIDSFGGGTIVGEDGKVTIDNPKVVEALTTAAGWITHGISPPEVLEYDAKKALDVFLSGNAVFMRNWPEAWAKAKDCKAKTGKCEVAVMALPRGGQGGKSTGTLGGWQLAVSRYSKHPEIAADLVKYLTSPEEQKRRAIEAARNPSVMALYKDREVLKANPFYASLLETFTNAVARPSRITGIRYGRVSSEFVKAVHSILSYPGTPEDKSKHLRKTLKDLQQTLERMSNDGRW